MFKEKYQRLNNFIKPSEELVNKVKNFSNKEVVKKVKKQKNVILKPAIAIITIVIVFFSMPVLASKVPSIYNLMYLVSPTVAQYFMPVQRFCENQGIKMEVVSANIYDNEAKIYITMQDLTEDRIDRTTDLNDSYSINRDFKCSACHCEFVGFDNKIKTATFLISIKDIENKKIDGKKITFIVNNFMSHKKEWENIKFPISFEDIDNNTETMQVRLSGFGSDEEKYMNLNPNEINNTVLVPKRDIDFGVTDMKITGIGYIDGKLHIQVSAKNNLKLDNHGEVYLKDNITGENKKSNYNLSFILWQNEDKLENETDNTKNANENRIDYTEYVFDIPKEELENYSIYGDFTASGLYVEGDWKVTFPLEKN